MIFDRIVFSFSRYSKNCSVFIVLFNSLLYEFHFTQIYVITDKEFENFVLFIQRSSTFMIQELYILCVLENIPSSILIRIILLHIHFVSLILSNHLRICCRSLFMHVNLFVPFLYDKFKFTFIYLIKL